MKKAVIYARVSSKKQEKDGTIESQIAALRKQVASAGDILVKEYLDNGYSGAKLDRPGLNQLRQDVKTDLFDAVYFHNTDRIAREVTYQTIIVGEILKQNKQVIINGRDYVENPENKFTLTVLGAVSELERAKIIERYSRGRMHKIRQGSLVSNGLRALGYTYIPKGLQAGRLIINEKEAEVVRLIFKMYANDGASKSKIIRYLEDNRIPTKTGRYMWQWKTLEGILKNHSYMGIKYFNTRTMVKEPSKPFRKVKYGKEVFKDKSEWLPVKVPAIISPELFAKTQERFESNRQKYRNPPQIRLLSNLLRCGECGSSCTAHKRFVRGYSYNKEKKLVKNGLIYHRESYICARRIRQIIHSKKTEMTRCSNPQIYTHLLEASVFSIVEEVMTNKNKLKDYIIGYKENRGSVRQEAENELKTIEQKISQLMLEKKDILEQYAKGQLNRDNYGRKCHEYDQKIDGVKTERNKLLSMVPALHKRSVVDTSIEKYCDAARTRLEKCADFDTKRQLLLDYLQKVAFVRGKVEVHGSVPIQLAAYSDPEQSSEAREVGFVIKSETSH
ncbi:MAG: hypothetical protein UY63_C0006G0035 [Parcubacteria group bacterium GW2011_GWA2_51_10]|nr:MAG: hypothetical protein UY63_C0006G0035 [Parcubacteria group bacterium GW2011_GWA2_51_10]